MVERGAILQPAMAYRFRVRCPLENGVDLTQAMMSVDIDLKNHRLTLIARQPVMSDFFVLADQLAGFRDHYTTTLYVDVMRSSAGDATFSMVFTSVTCLSHHLGFDYSSNELALHKFEFEYRNVVVAQPKQDKEEPSKRVLPDISQMKFDTPQEAAKKIKKELKKREKLVSKKPRLKN